MEIPVRLSAGLAQSIGSSRVQVSLKDGATLAGLLERLAEEYPQLAEKLPTTVAVVSGEHIDRSMPLTAGREVALLIPISGGSRSLKI